MRFLLLLLCAGTPFGASAQQERFVRTLTELRAAIQASEPGDTVVMANGTWTDAEIRFAARGAEGDTITLKAETPGNVVLAGRSSLRIDGEYLKVDGLWFEGGALTGGHVVQFRGSSSRLAHHSRLTNCAITNYNPPSAATEYKWVSIYGTENRVDHCYFANKAHDGATLVVWLRDPPNDVPGRHRIDNNYFGHRPDLGKNGGESVRIGTSSRSMQDALVTVEHNLFEECDGEIEIISNKTGSNTFRYNTFRRSSGMLTLRHGNGARVYGNFFLGEGKSGSGGVRIIGERHRVYNNYFQDLRGTGYRSAISVLQGVPNSPLNRYFQVKDAEIAFNTMVNVTQAFALGVGSSSDQSLAPDSLIIANNVVFSDGGSRDIVDTDLAPTNLEYDSNFFYGADTGVEDMEGITVTDPMLVSSGAIWRPTSDSPVVDAARAMALVTRDIDGQERDSTPDSGADEVATGPVLYRPLSAGDVGPPYLDTILSASAPAPLVSGVALESYPNPFVDEVALRYDVREAGPVKLSVFDLLGREVARLVDAPRSSGSGVIVLNAARLAPGVYVVALETRASREVHTIIKQ